MPAKMERAYGGNGSSDTSNGVGIGGGGGNGREEDLPPQLVAFRSTPETTAVRTTGLPKVSCYNTSIFVC